MAASSSAVRQDLGYVSSVCRVSAREYESDSLTTQPLDAAWWLPFQDYSPARVLPSFKGQRNFTGLLWCATNARLVGYESWLERDHLLALDFDPAVVGIASQPFRLDFELDGGHRWHIPDYFARLSDGTALVVDVRPDERIRERDQEVFTATESACASVGWGYRRVGGLPRAFVANLRWLSGYRHPRCLDPAHAHAMQECLHDGPTTIDHLSAAVGHPVTVLPTLFHLLWNGTFTTELRSRTLGHDSEVTLKAKP
ncbi:TnsA-like heteromeric transposase endonuclease subunit [Arthrobacter sp. NyZ413]|uniref:TnsA-like heteromeric transposase endonuclease subunit n=1 Tax=Arthrobacter sp. NyZ413 TaxID=3144669 RepID=UPI003BF7F475